MTETDAFWRNSTPFPKAYLYPSEFTQCYCAPRHLCVADVAVFQIYLELYRWVRVPVPVCVYYCISTLTFYYVDIASTDLNPIFAFATALILCCIDSTKSWNRSSEIVVLIEKISSQSCCTSMIHPILPHPKDACWIVIWSLS